jgi:hypothetical protein
MKCICGYEQDEEFDYIPVVTDIERNDTETETRIKIKSFKLYICPRCNTVKVKGKE